jgi:hypothetical protein
VGQLRSHFGSTCGERRLASRLPAICDFSITNVCNAACDFCGFARDKQLAGPARYANPADLARALPVLRRRGIRFMTLQGGEPLVHPEVVRLVSQIAHAGISCAVITNGWFLPRYIDRLIAAGLSRLIVSIDSADTAEHERNRGLPGLEPRLSEAIGRARASGIPVEASVTVSRLVRYEDLPDMLRRIGFDDVSFSYPRREPLGSVFDLDRIPDQRDPCHSCMMACYRSASIMMHAPLAAADAGEALAAGRAGAAAALLFRRSVAQSISALVAEMPEWRRKATYRRPNTPTPVAH